MTTITYSHIQHMNQKLEAKYMRLEASRNLLLDELEALDNTALNTPAAEGKWSINQTLAHLIKVEQLSLEYIQRKIKKEEQLLSVSLSHIISSTLLKLALLSGKKFKAPAVVADVPATATLSTLRQQWDDTRFRLEDLLTEFPQDLFDKCVFKHPFAGYLSISQTLSFIQDHFDHHLRQIQQQKKQLLR